MRKGFQFLKTRSLSDKLDIESYEKKNNIKLPLLIRTFYATFIVEPEGMYSDKLEYYDWIKDGTRIIGLIHRKYAPNRNILLYNFCSLENIVNATKNVFRSLKRAKEKGLLVIGDCASNGALTVGIKEENKDKIYLYNADFTNKKILLVAENIFEFIRGLESVKRDESVLKGVEGSYAQLYKKWGEDFWRMNENDVKQNN